MVKTTSAELFSLNCRLLIAVLLVLPGVLLLSFTAPMALAFAQMTFDPGSSTSHPISTAALAVCWLGGAIGTCIALFVSASIGLRSPSIRKVHAVAFGIGTASSIAAGILVGWLFGLPALIGLYAIDRLFGWSERT